MARYTILVEFELHDGMMERFLPPMLANANSSLADEPGCERLDVLRTTDGRDFIVLYEIYHDRAAFDAHCASPHFKQFGTATAGMIRTRKITELTFA